MDKKYGELTNYDIIMQGTMKKSPPQKSKTFFNFITKFSCTGESNKSSGLAKRWRNRHFVLFKTPGQSQVQLLYFKVEPALDSKNIGCINLVKLKNLSSDVGNTVNRLNVFSIETMNDTGGSRVYYLCAPSRDKMNVWVDKIVTSLNLNDPMSRGSSVLTLPLPPNNNTIQRITRGTPFNMPTPNSILRRSDMSPGGQRFSFSQLIERSNENATSSYSPGKSPFGQDILKDPFIAEEDDVYKNPCENSINQYVNLDGEENKSNVTKSNSSGDIFSPNDDNSFNFPNEMKFFDVHDFQEYKFPVDNLSLEYKNISCNPCDKKSQEKRSMEVDIGCFDFPLPTRLRSESLSSSCNSSDSSSSDEEVFNDNLFVEKNNESHNSVSNMALPIVKQCPPLVPKRLKLLEINKSKMTTETVLPIKTPKSFVSKNETCFNCTSFNAESLSAQNYMDNDNLLHDSHDHDLRDSPYCSLDVTPGHLSGGSVQQSELKTKELVNVGRDTPTHYNLEGHTSCTRFSMSANVVPLVEYREICDVRTEALLKLNVRILNSE